MVLAVQDTSSLNYTTHAATDGLGPIGSWPKGPQGLHLHSTLAFSTSGTPLGFVDVQCWARDVESFGKKAKRHSLPIEERESYKWIVSYRAVAAIQKRCRKTMLVSVGDREAGLLLTTVPVGAFEQAIEKLQWYARRWGIEVLHRTLKSGCRIEQRQLGHGDRLEACLAIDLVVAWRIFHLTKLGRDVPHAHCTVYFDEAEWKALMAFSSGSPAVPDKPPSLREAIRLVATLGAGRLSRTQRRWRTGHAELVARTTTPRRHRRHVARHALCDTTPLSSRLDYG